MPNRPPCATACVMTPAESVQAALEHLKTLGIEADCQVGDPVQDRQLAELAELAELAKIVLPADMLEFYRQFGDGYRLLWENEGEQVFGGFMLTPVQDV